jgi:hypothetical protein
MLSLTAGQAQQSMQDYVEALKQQREEAQDKLASAYMTIMRLQRELDLMKADEQKRLKGLEPKP